MGVDGDGTNQETSQATQGHTGNGNGGGNNSGRGGSINHDHSTTQAPGKGTEPTGNRSPSPVDNVLNPINSHSTVNYF